MMMMLSVGLWGLDSHGRFMDGSGSSGHTTMVGCCWHRSKGISSVRERVLADLAAVENQIRKEVSLLRITTAASRRARQHRLLYIFQCDLLPGLSGKILDCKVHRDDGQGEAYPTSSSNGGIALWAKALGYASVCGGNACMLFYVFLFALRQTKVRQDAWFRSFLTWLGLDTILVCTFVVVVSNIVVPSFIMKDIFKLKERLLSTLLAHRRSIGQVSAAEQSEEKKKNDGDGSRAAAAAAAPAAAATNDTIGREREEEEELNAAEFFFVSTRISRMEEFQHLLVASMISKFRTPWPRQSYQQHVAGQDDDSSTPRMYHRSHYYWSAVVLAVKSFLVFLVGGFVQLPPSFQDSVVYMAFSAACGYLIVLLTQLYSIHPSLIAVPVATSIVLTHYIIRFITAAVRQQQLLLLLQQQQQQPIAASEGESTGQGDATIRNTVTDDPNPKSRRASLMMEGMSIETTIQVQ